ncbi:Reverse gyrase 1 [Candidatus Burarchaeum australiense]|nr:Reverse gyrase 1 [Candidatus Burarchaeum australiense]
MQLIICEKPKVAEKVANALAEGKIERGELFGVPHYTLKRHGKDIVVAPAVGHLYSLRQAKGTGGYPVFDIEWAPTAEVEKKSAFSIKYLKAIESLAKKAKEFVNSCDYDSEGSLIGYNIIRFAGKAEKGRRMKFSALTTEDLVEAYDNADELDYGNIRAGEARHMLDWFYGINLSRALMDAIKKAGTFKLMSIGRVQGPALKILEEREKAIMAFKPEPYWELSALARDTVFMNCRGRFVKKEEADAALGRTAKEGAVSAVEVRQFEQAPPVPFDLTSLQVEAFRWFHFSPSQTLQLAQSLYEASFISYPRTSSQKLPEKLNHPKLLSVLGRNEAYKELAAKLIATGRTKPHEGKKEDPAHPAIHPISGSRPNEEREGKLFDLIARRYLACFAEPAMRESGRIELQLGEEKYETRGTRTVARNWMDYYGPYAKFEEISLPPLAKGEAVKAEKLAIHEKKTKPPARFTQASIVEELESRDLGTKATRSVIIETLYRRGYVHDSSIRVTPFGLAVCEALEHNCPEILDEELTRKVEREMEFIRTGELTEKKVLEDGKAVLRAILEEFRSNEEKIGKELRGAIQETREQQNMLGKCKACGGDLRIIRLRTGSVFVGCSNYPKCRNSYPLPQRGKILPLGTMCEKCGTPRVRVIREGSKPFEMCIDPKCETKKDWGKPRPNPAATAVVKAAAKPAVSAGAEPAVEKPAQKISELATAAKAQPAEAKPAPKAIAKTVSKKEKSTTLGKGKRKLSDGKK